MKMSKEVDDNKKREKSTKHRRRHDRDRGSQQDENRPKEKDRTKVVHGEDRSLSHVKVEPNFLTDAPTTSKSGSRVCSVKQEPEDSLSHQPSAFEPTYAAFTEPVYPPYPQRIEPEICQYWLEGNCPKSAKECRFYHEGEVTKVFQNCKFYMSKGCSKGKACPYMHELFPCRKFHLILECEESPCKFSHEPLTELTRPLFEEEVIWWRDEVEIAISLKKEEGPPELVKLLTDIDRNMQRLNLQMPPRPPPLPEEEVNYSGYQGPNGKTSAMRYAMNGTRNLLRYANDNTAKWEAYERKYRKRQARRAREAEEAAEEEDYYDSEWSEDGCDVAETKPDPRRSVRSIVSIKSEPETRAYEPKIERRTATHGRGKENRLAREAEARMRCDEGERRTGGGERRTGGGERRRGEGKQRRGEGEEGRGEGERGREEGERGRGEDKRGRGTRREEQTESPKRDDRSERQNRTECETESAEKTLSHKLEEAKPKRWKLDRTYRPRRRSSSSSPPPSSPVAPLTSQNVKVEHDRI